MSDLTIVSGATGPRGAPGQAVLSGTGAPSSMIGNIGDFYIDATAWTIYGPKASNGWPTGASIIGPQGPPGFGSKALVSETYAIVAGVAYVMVDCRGGSVTIDLNSLVSDVDVIVKDLYDAVNGTTIVITAQGAVDGMVNPPLVTVAGAWSRLLYTASIDKWSFAG